MIYLVKSTFYKESKTKKKLLEFIKKTKYLSFGKECEKFEKSFAEYQGRRHCVFVNSGSSANLALIQAVLNLGRLKKGDNVGFSSLTWSTNVMPLIQLGLNAIPIDVELDTLNVSGKKILESFKAHPLKALLLTNLLGLCDDVDNIKRICREREIVLLEDTCESLGTVYKGIKLGNFGYAATFSFYVGHHLSTIEGGAVCTDDDDLANMLRIVRAHGWDRNLNFAGQNKMRTKFKISSPFYSRYTFYDLGFNLRPTEVAGCIGNIQLRYINEIIKKRNKNFLTFAREIYSMGNLYYPIRYNHIKFISNFAVPVICRTQRIRDDLVKRCKGKIEIRPIVGGDVTSQPFSSKYMKSFSGRNPNARLVHEQGLYFPNNPELTKEEIQTIINVFTM